ncbi:hypothetical protein DERF_013190, partial [Dermatophagoides farinae]
QRHKNQFHFVSGQSDINISRNDLFFISFIMTQIKGVLPGVTIPYMMGLTRRWVRSGATFGAASFISHYILL